MSQELHEELADLFEIDIGKIPDISRAEMGSICFEEAVVMLDFIEEEGGGCADICRILRYCLAIHLTPREREVYMGLEPWDELEESESGRDD